MSAPDPHDLIRAFLSGLGVADDGVDAVAWDAGRNSRMFAAGADGVSLGDLALASIAGDLRTLLGELGTTHRLMRELLSADARAAADRAGRDRPIAGRGPSVLATLHGRPDPTAAAPPVPSVEVLPDPDGDDAYTVAGFDRAAPPHWHGHRARDPWPDYRHAHDLGQQSHTHHQES